MSTFTVTLEPWEIEILRDRTILAFTVNGDQVTFDNQARYPLAAELGLWLDFGEITAYEALDEAD